MQPRPFGFSEVKSLESVILSGVSIDSTSQACVTGILYNYINNSYNYSSTYMQLKHNLCA